jgi:salicylate 5-hydroxylase large subunit
MSADALTARDDLSWKDEGSSRVPFWAYTDQDVYKRELERIFYSGHWCYVGLEAEIPNPGDFKRSVVGERSVIMVRDQDGSVNVVENVCAHRGVQICRVKRGNHKEITCPYHQWSYDLKGNLMGVPFRRGVKKDGKVVGGFPSDFKPEQHGLTKLNVAVRGGVVFASFDHNMESLEDYLGPDVLKYFDRTFNGRKLKILGYNRQRIPANWKLMMENVKDPYHAALLHVWFVMFGLLRADSKSSLVTDEKLRHGVLTTVRDASYASDQVKQQASFKEDMKLNDDRFLDVVPEPWWNGPTAAMMTLFPSVIIQQQVNALSTRHIQPDGTGAFNFIWTHFGFEDDTPEMETRRLRQANLFGPAGFVSADDGEAVEYSQDGFKQKPFASTISELDGRGTGSVDHMVSDTLIRGMYAYWRKVMEI